MASQTILWLTLPNGFVQDDDVTSRRRISVFVSPRLTPDAERILAPFDFLDWPSLVVPTKVEFTVEIDSPEGRFQVPAQQVSMPESRLWQAIFTRETFVRGHPTERLSRTVGSFPEAALHDDIKAGYQEVCARFPLSRPTPAGLRRAFSDDLTRSISATEFLVSDDDRFDAEARLRFADGLLVPGGAFRTERLMAMARSEGAEVSNPDEPIEIVPRRPVQTPSNNFAQFVAFQQQLDHANPVTRTRSAEADRLDFHQLVTLLGEYPHVLRLLGLVIDLEVDLQGLGRLVAGNIRVLPKFASELKVKDTHMMRPATRFRNFSNFRADTFSFSDARRALESGFLDLHATAELDSSDRRFRLVQVDVHGAAIETLNTLQKSLERDDPTELNGTSSEHEVGLASLRSSGISISEGSSAKRMHKTVTATLQGLRDEQLDDASALRAEELLRGYRVDVREAARDNVFGEWRSLHQRAGAYHFLNLPDAPRTIVDEGFIEPGAVQPRVEGTSHDPDKPIYVAESVCLWQGWSLSVPRPGKVLDDQAEEPPAPDFKLSSTFTPVARTLPRLRFGRQYQVRARAVDISGNGLTLEQANRIDAQPVLPVDDEFRFLRFEVIPSPVLVPRAKLTEGDSIDQIVVRSNHDEKPAEFANRHPQYRRANERHVVPPKTWQLMAEMHGLFDASIGTGRDAAKTYAIARREKGSLLDPVTGGAGPTNIVQRVPIREGTEGSEYAVHPEAQLRVPYLPDPLAAGAVFRNLPGAPAERIGRVTSNGDLLLEPSSLPAERAKEAGPLTLVDFGPASSWPEFQPFRLELIEGNAPPRWDANERVLTVALEKGQTKTVRMSCHLRDVEELKLLGIWQWMVEWLDKEQAEGRLSESEKARELDTFVQQSLLGLWWMQTPYRDLTLVHAVQQPAIAPTIDGPGPFPRPIKLAGDTFVYIRGELRVHGASTGKVDLIASWKEYVDDPLAKEPSDAETENLVFETQLHVPVDTAPDGAEGEEDPVPPARFSSALDRLEYLGPRMEELFRNIDGKVGEIAKAADRGKVDEPSVNEFLVSARLVQHLHPTQRWPVLAREAGAISVATVGTTNPPVGDDPPRGPGSAGGGPAGPPPAESPDERVRAALAAIQTAASNLPGETGHGLKQLKNHTGRHDFGDTKHRVVTYKVIATTRFREYFPTTITNNAANISHTTAAAPVSVLSSARPAPPVVQYIVPLFQWERAPQGPTVRRGGGLRVYLDRPWYSSGEGELLGVVISQGSEPVERFTSQWGRDPLWTTDPVAALSVSDFLNVAKRGNLLEPVEAAAPRFVTVLGYKPSFDKATRRWFCDIELNSEHAYFPFVRLALVRYQPESVSGYEISSIVLTDFAQLAPNRTVTLSQSPSDSNLTLLTVVGTTHRSRIDESPEEGTRVRVRVDERVPGTTDEAGWQPATGQVRVDATSPVPNGEQLWSGQVTLPSERIPGQFRIVIQEVEIHLAVVSRSERRRVERTIFAETIEV